MNDIHRSLRGELADMRRRLALALRLSLAIAGVVAGTNAPASQSPTGARLNASVNQAGTTPDVASMNQIAERYVKLVLAVGKYDSDYVDAYYGPPAWRAEVEAAPPPLDEIERRADALIAQLNTVPPPSAADEMVQLRHQYLDRQLSALRARVRMLRGAKLSFDEESRALYDATAPTHTEQEFGDVLAELDRLLPGSPPLIARYDAFKSRFIIPRDKLDAVFTAAIDACRTRTREHITLSPDERFTVEYVTGKSWGAYNWYQGNFRSLIQVNTDLPVYIDRAIDMGCHEGYPGHHVYNALLEQQLVKGRGWVEFSVYPLFSPQSLIAEGTANYGIEVAFSEAERVAFEKRVLFPMAGLDPSTADSYHGVQKQVDKLSYAVNEAARRYLNGQADRDAAASWLERFGMLERPRAEQRVRFMDQYRSYVINYNLGKDLVKAYIEKKSASAADQRKARWTAFAELLSSPRLPSGL